MPDLCSCICSFVHHIYLLSISMAGFPSLPLYMQDLFALCLCMTCLALCTCMTCFALCPSMTCFALSIYDLFCSCCPYMLVYAQDLSASHICLAHNPTVHVHLQQSSLQLAQVYDLFLLLLPMHICLYPFMTSYIYIYIWFDWLSLYPHEFAYLCSV